MTKSQAIKAMRELADRLEASGLPEDTPEIYVKVSIHNVTSPTAKTFMQITDQPHKGYLNDGIAWYSTEENSDDPQVTAFLKWGLTH